jgi:hypothetical protein
LDPSVPVDAIFRKCDLDVLWESDGRQPDVQRDRSIAATVRDQPHR